jgi:Tfp pilus assembly protein PilN
MRVFDLMMTFVLLGLCVALAVGLVTARHQVQAQARQIWVLEQQVNALYLAADWDVEAL